MVDCNSKTIKLKKVKQLLKQFWIKTQQGTVLFKCRTDIWAQYIDLAMKHC